MYNKLKYILKGDFMIENIVNYFIINGIIEEKEKEIYAYGLHQGLLIILNVATTIIIGILFNMLWESMIFMISYIPLRTYAGGYHARTQCKCYLFSIAIIITSLLLIIIIPTTGFFILSLIITSGITIYVLAPVEDNNKPLDTIEKKSYKKLTKNILIIEILAILVLYILKFKNMSLVICIAIFILSCMLVIGKFKNKLRR